MLGYFSHPDEREGKVFVFPHLFAEVMARLHGGARRERARPRGDRRDRVRATPGTIRSRRCAACELTLDVAEALEGVNRYIVDGLPLKTYDCSQITDGYAALIVATEEGLTQARSEAGLVCESPAGPRRPIR